MFCGPWNEIGIVSLTNPSCSWMTYVTGPKYFVSTLFNITGIRIPEVANQQMKWWLTFGVYVGILLVLKKWC